MPPRGRCGASPCPWSSSRRRESGNTGEGPVRTSQDRPGRRNASEAPPVKRGVTVEYAGRHDYSITPPGNSMLPFPGEMEESPVGRLVEIFPEAKEDAEKALSHVEIVKAFRSEAWRMHKARLAGAGLTDTAPPDDYPTLAIGSD